MITVAPLVLAMLLLVSVPRLGAEEVKTIGRDFSFDAPPILRAGITTFIFENPGAVRDDNRSATTGRDGTADSGSPSGEYAATEVDGAVC